MSRPGKRFWFKFTAAGLSMAVALVLAELACAVLFPSPFVTTDILGRRIRDRPRLPSRTLRHREAEYQDLMPGYRGRESLLGDYDYPFTINALGLRDREVAPKDGRLRVLVMGDSQTYGLGVEEGKTFCDLLEAALRRRGRDGVEVVNAGVPGYGTFEARWKLERIAPIVRPDLVLAVVHAENALVYDEGNDLYNNYVRLLKDNPGQPASPTRRPKLAFVANHMHLYSLLSGIKNQLIRQTYTDQVRAARARGVEGDLAKVWETTRRLLKEMDRIARETSGARLAVVYMPGLASLELDDSSVLQELRAADLPVLSLFDALQSARAGRSMRLRFPHDGHYNTFAHAVIAEALADGIIERGLLEPKAKTAGP